MKKQTAYHRYSGHRQRHISEFDSGVNIRETLSAPLVLRFAQPANIETLSQDELQRMLEQGYYSIAGEQ